MDDIKKQVETIEKETFVISGKVFKLFKDWLRTTKLSRQKIRILNILDSENFMELETISKKLKMSLPLLSYHINGNLKSDGLFNTEIIDKMNLDHGKVGIRLNDFGNLILKTCKE